MRMRVNGLMILSLVAVLLAGCGESSSPSTTASSASTTAASPGAASRGRSRIESSYAKALSAAEAAAPKHLSGEAVAIVDGTPITKANYDHWLQVSAPAGVKSLMANPSDYSGCIAAARSREERNRKLVKESEERYAKQFKGRKAPGFAAGRNTPVSEAQLKLQCEQQYKSAKQQAVRTLIMRASAEIKAKELGVSLNQSEVAKRVKEREESQKRLAKTARYSEFAEANYSKADLEEMIKSEVLETQINTRVREKLAKPGALSQEKLEKYFNEHKQLYGEPERRSIVYARTSSKSTAEAIAGEHGSLATAASKHGTTTTSTSIGCQQQARTGSEGILAKICAAKAGAISGPISPTSAAKAASIYFVFEVKSTTPATKPNFSQVKERIKLTLFSQGESQAVFKYEEESRAKLRARTECAAGYVVELCKEYKPPRPVGISKARVK